MDKHLKAAEPGHYDTKSRGLNGEPKHKKERLVDFMQELIIKKLQFFGIDGYSSLIV